MKAAWRRGIIRGAVQPGDPVVLKLGGSLLTRPAWPREVAGLVAADWPTLVIVGGGSVVDGLRRIDAAAARPAAVMHAAAIDAMGITARIVAEALGLPVVDAPAAAAGVLDAAAWLRTGPAGSTLPVGWESTSDSIAAVAAEAIGRPLLLAKSVPPPCPGDDLAGLASGGWVDRHFPIAAFGLTAIGWLAPPP